MPVIIEPRFELADLREAQEGLKGIARQTPLLPLSDLAQAPVRLKAEFLQPIGAFKIRGAWTAIRRLPEATRARGVVTTSSGNHGLGVAWTAREFGIPAVIVMPRSAAAIKIAGITALGAKTLLVGDRRGPEQDLAAAELVEQQGLTLIPPFDHPDVIAGQATCAMEIIEQWPEVETLVVPVGGGGLLAGTCCAARALKRNIRIIAVEPAEVPKLSAAFEHGGPVDIDPGKSIADGLLTRSIGHLTWLQIQSRVNLVVSVTDNEIRTALRWLAQRQITTEPSGSVAVAALQAGRFSVDGPTALLASGGNIDPELREEYLQA